MNDDTPAKRASSGSGQADVARPVYFYDLENFMLRIENQISNLGKDIAESAKRHDAYETKVDTNEKEIEKLRQHFHQQANAVTVLNAKTSALEPRVVVELIRLIPVMQHLEKIAERRELQDVLTADELIWVRAEKLALEKRRQSDEQVSIGRRIQTYVLPALLVLFIVEQVIAPYLHWHP